jgi:hypothetical protein
MESSTVLAFRIFVMLSCLIIVPMAAIFGSAFPDVVKTVLVDRIVAFATGKPVESNKAPGEAPGFSQVSAAPGGTSQWEAPRWGGSASDTAAWQAPQGSVQAGGVTPAGASGAHQGGGNQSAVFAAPADTARSVAPAFAPDRQPGDDVGRRAAEVTPVAHQMGASIAPTQPTVDMPASPGQVAPGGLPEPPDRFTAMERKLREYGAVYYLLETWGNDGELFRFHCRMAMANNPNYTRHFEATDRDALKAMSQVLSRVEAWRAGRLQ